MGRRKSPMDNIERDSLRALELGYGVHYGHYKADYPNTAPREEEPDYEALGYKECPECGKWFRPRGCQRWCGDECRVKVSSRRQNEWKRRNRERS